MLLRLVRNLKELLAIMRLDPSIAHKLPVVGRLARRTSIWLLLTEFFQVGQVFPVKLLFDELNGEKRPVALVSIVAAMGLIYAISTELRGFTGNHRSEFRDQMWVVWWGYGHRLLLRLSADWNVRHSTGEKESMVSQNIHRFEGLVLELLFETIPATLRISFTTLFMFFIGWQFGLVSLVTQTTYYLAMWRNDKRFEPIRIARREEMIRLERMGTEMTVNWRTIKSLGSEEEFSDENDQALENYATAELYRTSTSNRIIANQEQIIVLSRVVLYASIGYVAFNGGAAVMGGMFLAYTLMERSYSNYFRYGDFQQRMNEGVEAMRQLVDLMCLPPTVQCSLNPIVPAEPQGQVVFDDVSFAYPDAPDCTLRHINLKVEPFTATALVGMSGCGKTTLMSLLQREYDPSEGRILVDDIDLRDFDYGHYRQQTLGIISQQPQLFTKSIMDNIRMGNPMASDQEVIEAAKLACAHDFIVNKPDGYQAIVGENGINLSGGERQRLAIARALVRKPSVLIMDEATSALDALSQHKFQETIDSLIASRTCTIFIIAHRFPTIMSVDQVVVLDEGGIAEIGTHQQLARMNGLYSRLRDLESQGLL